MALRTKKDKVIFGVASVLAVAGIVTAVTVPVVQINNSTTPTQQEEVDKPDDYGNGIYFDDYHYVPETAYNHEVNSPTDSEVNYGSVWYKSNIPINVDGTNPDYGEALFDEEQYIDTYEWVNPFLVGTSSRYINSNVIGSGFVSSAGTGSYSNDLVDLESYTFITEYYFAREDENDGSWHRFSVEYVEQYEVTRMFDTNDDGIKDSGIELVLDEALVLFNHYKGTDIGYLNLTTANLFIDGVEYDLLNADQLDNSDELINTIIEWTYQGPGGTVLPEDAYLGSVEGALALFAINSSIAGLETGVPIYTTTWVNNWYEVKTYTNTDGSEYLSHTNDGTTFNTYLEYLDAAERVKQVR